jgi:hypothetical protein
MGPVVLSRPVVMKKSTTQPWDTPGQPGKGRRNWSAGPLPAERLNRHMSPVPLDGVAPASTRIKELRGEVRRTETAPSRVRSCEGFDLHDRRSGPEGRGYYCEPVRTWTSGETTSPKGSPIGVERESDGQVRGVRESGKARKNSYLGRPKNRATQL